MTRCLALLVNPTSGKGRGGRLLDPVADRLRHSGIDVDVVVGRDADEAFDRLRNRVAAGVDGVVAVGGDGLVNLALQVVGRHRRTARDRPGRDRQRHRPRARSPVGRPGRGRRPRRRPAGPDRSTSDGRAGAGSRGVLGSGFDSMVNERANRMTWPSGRSRYNLAILAELRTFQPVPYSLELDGETWQTEAMLVAVGNGPSYGGGMRVCPDARLDDGLLDVTVLGPISKLEFLRVFPTVYKGTHVAHPAVTVRRARQVSITSPGVTAYADGERVSVLPVHVEAVPGALRVFAAG